MADSLDDFFAKKDKKRSKDKSKTVFSAEALVRELEEGSKQADYPVRKENKASAAIELLGLDADDADWRDFEDVDKRDYTGLKVKEMSLQDQNEEEQRRITSEQSDQVLEPTPWRMKEEQSSSATTELSSAAKPKAPNSKEPDLSTTVSDTKSVSSSTKDEQAKQQAPQQKQEIEEDTGKTSQETSSESTEKEGDKPSASPKKYVPPAGRGLTNDVKTLAPSKLGRGSSSNARHGPIPNIQNEQDFPSLG